MKILLVDDDHKLAVVLAELLTLDGHTVIAVLPDMAMDRWGALDFDVLISDVEMEISGFELAEKLLDIRRRPVIFMSGNPKYQGINNLLLKPVSRETFYRAFAALGLPCG